MRARTLLAGTGGYRITLLLNTRFKYRRLLMGYYGLVLSLIILGGVLSGPKLKRCLR